jgi:hypothetical protein
VRPADCALLLAVPLRRSEFLADLAAGTDFLAHFVARQRSRDIDVLWATYDASAAMAYASAERARRRGVTVRRRAVLADFARCLHEFQVVTLVAHWRAAGLAVEFADGLAPVECVVEAVPPAFEGVLDLTVCNARPLAEEIRRRCPRARIIDNPFPATLDMGLELYNATMDLLQRHQMPYEDAMLGARH